MAEPCAGRQVFCHSQFVASELARLDTIQGDIDTLSQRIAAVRTWTYIAHRADWLAEPHIMAERARAVGRKALRSPSFKHFASVLSISEPQCCCAKAASDAELFPVEIAYRQSRFSGR